ncbi:MAG: arylsulfatase [Acidobacteriaceae bacterium]
MLERLKRYWIKIAISAMVISPALAKAAPAAPSETATGANSGKPNVLVVVIDDVGYSDLGCYGGEIHTPNIDRLARDGVRYIRFDTNAVCSATRASLLTGRNSQTVKMSFLAASDPSQLRAMSEGNPQLAKFVKGLLTVNPGWRDPKDQSPRRGWMAQNAETIAQALKTDGYATWAIGKWHLAPQWEDGSKGNNIDFPDQRGFDYFYGYRDGWTDQYRPILDENNTRLPIPVYPYGDMLAWDLANHAIAEMKENRAQHAKKPFFLYLAFTQAHAPIQVTQNYIDQYDGVYDKGWDAIRTQRLLREKKMGVVPDNAVLPARNPGDPAWNSLSDQQRRVYARFMQGYAGYLQYGDQQLGRVLAYMRESGIAKNTLIVLISDNGPASETKSGGFYTPYGDRTTLAEMDAHLNELGGPQAEPLYQRAWAMAGATPFRRYKLWPYLGGVRDALIVDWPGHIKDPGGIRKQYVHVIDVAPTILQAGGTHFDDSIDGVKQIPVAGRSFLQTISDPNAPAPQTTQYFLLLGNRAVTSNNWRAVAMHQPGTPFSQDRWQLFNLTEDPTEIHDLAPANPVKLKQMKALWQNEAGKYGALPLKESPFGRASGFSDAFLANQHDY